MNLQSGTKGLHKKRPAPRPPIIINIANKHILELEKASIDQQLRILLSQPDVLKKRSDVIKQQKLIDRLVEILEIKRKAAFEGIQLVVKQLYPILQMFPFSE